ncbi:MAG: hypothetical protein KIY12_08615 [Thermoplasmata archaeon]|uniref:Uncharacterized protein n=1 Tax=Candidatus Sysuiplasma superficiale TaxID=2823368 RepID=A0A8J7YYJ9_9ARCH|nr:hypothetical protein [Candidatus Sysuiplasma superficiale]MBX8644766.1 hypothetical protein [Candidatus Sysuiplasma superficiale]MCL4346366.1 hypothetical protein [Candidatus Thermoplasmatota archaeon]
MMSSDTVSSRDSHLLNEISELRRELLRIEEHESELRTSLSEAKRQLSYYRALISSMKKTVSPPALKKLLRSL